MTDIPEIRHIIEIGHANSHFGKNGLVKVHRGIATDYLTHCVNASFEKPDLVFFKVFEKTKINAFLIASMQPVYIVGDKLSASDQKWLSRPNTKGGLELMKIMIEWAKANKLCVEIKCGTTALIQNPKKAGKFLERQGFTHYGDIYRREIK